ncbi:MAG: dihydroneopterin aldolase [Oligoflexales bacterium]
MATLEIERYPIFVRIGHYAQERLQGQEVLVSIVAELPTLPEHIELEDTVDYSHIFALMDDLLKDQDVYLLETAVNRLGVGLCAAFSMLKHLRVTIEKPVLPDGLNRGARVSISEVFLHQG